MKGFKNMSPADARHIALLCVGVAVLIIGAVFLSEGTKNTASLTSVTPSSQTASWLSCFLWGCDSSATPTKRCNIFLNPTKINAGETSILSWSKGGTKMTITAYIGTSTKGTVSGTYEFAKSSDVAGSKDQADHGFMPVSPSVTTTYRGFPTYSDYKEQACKITLPVVAAGDSIEAPSVTIAADAPLVAGIPTIAIGDSTLITSTYVAHADGSTIDELTGAAINGPNSTNSAIDGGNWDTAAAAKSYLFEPEEVGDYTFTPAVKSLFFPDWNDYGKSVTIHVTADPTEDVCSNIAGQQSAAPSNGYVAGTRCVCEVGFSLDSTAGTCTSGTDVCTGSNFPGIQSSLPPNAQSDTSTTCSCKSDYVLVTGSCIAPTVTAFYANPSLVRVGASTALYWKVQNPPATCRLTGSDGTDSVIPRALLNSGSMPTAPIRDTTTFTFRCGAAQASQATVRLIPVFDEI